MLGVCLVCFFELNLRLSPRWEASLCDGCKKYQLFRPMRKHEKVYREVVGIDKDPVITLLKLLHREQQSASQLEPGLKHGFLE